MKCYGQIGNGRERISRKSKYHFYALFRLAMVTLVTSKNSKFKALCYFLVSKYYNYDQLGRLPCKMQLKFPSTIRGRNLKAQQSPVILDH